MSSWNMDILEANERNGHKNWRILIFICDKEFYDCGMWMFTEWSHFSFFSCIKWKLNEKTFSKWKRASFWKKNDDRKKFLCSNYFKLHQETMMNGIWTPIFIVSQCIAHNLTLNLQGKRNKTDREQSTHRTNECIHKSAKCFV